MPGQARTKSNSVIYHIIVREINNERILKLKYIK